MDRIRPLALALVILLGLTACTPGEATPTLAVCYDPSQYNSREEFHSVVRDFFRVFDGEGGRLADPSPLMTERERTEALYNKVDEAVSYFDFASLPDELAFDFVIICQSYIHLCYQSIDEEKVGYANSLSLICYRKVDPDVSPNVSNFRTPDSVDIEIAGKTVIRTQAYPYADGVYRGNEYHWLEEGYSMEMYIPLWLLELYPEETFFDIHTVDLTEEDT